jgi:hypothetical protein
MGNQELLDAFGSAFITEARDEAIKMFHAIVEGSIGSEQAQRLYEEFATLGSEEAVKAEHLARAVIDETLHNVLWMFERLDRFDVAETIPDGTIVSVKNASDGLSGELYAANGWLARFSSFGEDV